MPAAKLLSRLCSRASVNRFRMRSHPCFATGVNMALLSLLLRGAAGFRCSSGGGGDGGGSSSGRLRAGCSIASRVHHRLLEDVSHGNDDGHRSSVRISNRMCSSSSSSSGSSSGSGRPSTFSGSRPLAPHALQGFVCGGGGCRSMSSRRRPRSRGDTNQTTLRAQNASKSSRDGSMPPPPPPQQQQQRQRRRAAPPGPEKIAGEVRVPTARRQQRRKASSTSDDLNKNKTTKKKKRGRSSSSSNRGQQQDSKIPVFGLDIPGSRVHVVDTPDRLEAVGAILGKSVLMSIDTETQPSFKVGQWYPTSLLQIATRDEMGEEDVVVIDLLSLKDGLRLPEGLSAVLSGPFASPDVFKLGVGITQDLNEMFFAFGKAPFLKKVPGVLNLNVLHAKSRGGVDSQEVSLRKLTSIHLGCALSKRQQMSRWARRPLLDAQIVYAACDVLVALRVFDVLLEASGEVDLQELSSTWMPKSPSEEGLVKDKVVRLRRRIAARKRAMGQQHIQYERKGKEKPQGG